MKLVYKNMNVNPGLINPGLIHWVGTIFTRKPRLLGDTPNSSTRCFFNPGLPFPYIIVHFDPGCSLDLMEGRRLLMYR